MNADHCPINCSLLVAPKATYEECDSPIVVTQGHFLSGAPYAVVMVELIFPSSATRAQKSSRSQASFDGLRGRYKDKQVIAGQRLADTLGKQGNSLGLSGQTDSVTEMT